MILVTLGTNDKPFTRLLDAVEAAIAQGIIQEEVIVQAGFTRYKSDRMKVIDYIDREQFADYLAKADLLITHGGAGTIMTGLNQGKRILAAARLSAYGEHVNDHQIQLLEAFESKGYLIYMKDLKELGTYLAQARSFTPRPYVSQRDHMIEQIETWIEQNVNRNESV